MRNHLYRHLFIYYCRCRSRRRKCIINNVLETGKSGSISQNFFPIRTAEKKQITTSVGTVWKTTEGTWKGPATTLTSVISGGQLRSLPPLSPDFVPGHPSRRRPTVPDLAEKRWIVLAPGEDSESLSSAFHSGELTFPEPSRSIARPFPDLNIDRVTGEIRAWRHSVSRGRPGSPTALPSPPAHGVHVLQPLGQARSLRVRPRHASCPAFSRSSASYVKL